MVNFLHRFEPEKRKNCFSEEHFLGLGTWIDNLQFNVALRRTLFLLLPDWIPYQDVITSQKWKGKNTLIN